MLKKTMTYTDYNGDERTEDFYFNLSKAELMEMELGVSGGFSEMVQRITVTRNVPELVKVFKELVLKAYGVKSPDGKRFIKNDEIRDEFAQTEAYSDLFMELVSDANAASEFVNGVIPTDLAKEAAKEAAKAGNQQLLMPAT